jgi:hypothetical protein
MMTPAASYWRTASAPATHAILYSFMPRFSCDRNNKEAVQSFFSFRLSKGIGEQLNEHAQKKWNKLEHSTPCGD